MCARHVPWRSLAALGEYHQQETTHVYKEANPCEKSMLHIQRGETSLRQADVVTCPHQLQPAFPGMLALAANSAVSAGSRNSQGIPQSSGHGA